MENVDSIVPEHATDTARELAATTEFWEGYRRGGFSPDVENPYPEPNCPTPADPHTRFAFGQNRAMAQERDGEYDPPEFAKQNPLLSRDRVGADRWFWIVAGDWDMICFGRGIDLLHHGTEPTAEKAEAAARGIYPDAEPPGRRVAQNARRYWDMLKASERQAEDSQTDGSKRMEFVYSVHTLLCSPEPYLHKHRHIKTTEKRIFIAEERWKLEKKRFGSWRDYDVKRLSLDREEMDAQGFVKRSNSGIFDRYFLDYEDAVEHMKSDTPGGAANDTPPECLHVLGLEAGAMEADVKEAFRAQSKELHPDHGGDAAAFRRLRDAYEDALETV